jgi:chaperone modulatory protein CbpM
MRTLSEVLTACGIGRDELVTWIERRWIMPLTSGSEYLFSEADLARAQMIAEFRRDLALDDDALSLVLDLVDQLHATRRRLRQLVAVVCELPDDQCQSILQRLDTVSKSDR